MSDAHEGPPRGDAKPRGSGGEPPTRRDLLDAVLAAGSVVWAAGVAVPAAMYLWPARAEGPTKKSLEVDPGTVPPGSGSVLQGTAQPILLLHLASGQFRAFSAVCTHLGCIVEWDAKQGRILCPCHGGVFAPDGSVVGGPPPRPLAEYPLRIADGKVRIQT